MFDDIPVFWCPTWPHLFLHQLWWQGKLTKPQVEPPSGQHSICFYWKKINITFLIFLLFEYLQCLSHYMYIPVIGLLLFCWCGMYTWKHIEFMFSHEKYPSVHLNLDRMSYIHCIYNYYVGSATAFFRCICIL